MNILQVMGCTSDQYASMERYLIGKAQELSQEESQLVVVYENTPRSERFVGDLLEAGGLLVCLKLRGIWDVSYYSRVCALIKERKINIVHCYFTPTCHYLAEALRLKGFRNVVRTAANMPFGVPRYGNGGIRPGFGTRLRHRALALPFRKVICRSEGVRDAFRELGIADSRLAVADGGCDTERYRFSHEARLRLRQELGIGQSDLVLGVCCRLVPVKRLDRLIRLVASSNKADFGWKVLVAGSGPEREGLESLARELDCTDHVRLLGHRDEVPDLCSAFDVFCLPSEAEGMSNGILEAMACRLPVLASDIPPNRELVQPGKNGYLLSFADAEEFKKCLRNLAVPSVRHEMGDLGRSLVKSRYSLDTRIRREIDIYQEVLG